MKFLGISAVRMIAAGAVLFFFIFLKKVIAKYATSALLRFAKRTRTELDDIVIPTVLKPLEYLVVIAGAFIAVGILDLPVKPFDFKRWAVILLKLCVTVDITWLFLTAADAVIEYLERSAVQLKSKIDGRMLPLLRTIARGVIFVIAFVAVIQNLGYSASGLIAGLGLGGLAFALAAKDTLSNLFGSIMIFTDRPFSVGDTIKAGDISGTVEEVGVRSTKIRTPELTLLSVPNSTLAALPVNNISRRKKTLCEFSIPLDGNSPPSIVKEIVAELESEINNHPGVDKEDPISVRLSALTETGAIIKIRYFLNTMDQYEAAYIQQEIYLKFMETAAKKGISISPKP